MFSSSCKYYITAFIYHHRYSKMTTIIDGIQTVKVYFRSSSKYAKISHFPITTSTDELYLFVCNSQDIPIDRLHLYFKGNLLSSSQTITLEKNAIIHIVRLEELEKETITVSVKKIEGDKRSYRFQVNANIITKRFIDERLSEVYSQTSNDIFLVHLGRQININNTLRQQEVENGSELLCLSFQQEQRLTPAMPKQQSAQSTEYKVTTTMPIGQLQTPQAPKDIYPTSNFAIGVPQGIQTKNSLNLIFDSKVRRSSSIGNIDLDPNQVIAEEDSQIQLTKRNQSYQSEHAEDDHHPNQSRFSEQWKRKESDHDDSQLGQQFERVNMIGKEKEGEVDFKAGDLIYAGDFHMLAEKNVMGGFINSYKQKITKTASNDKE